MGSTRPMWIGLGWTYMMGWVEFFLTHHGELGQKIPLTRPMHTPNSRHSHLYLIGCDELEINKILL